MKYAANLSLMYPGLPWDQRIACASADGFSGVEIQFPYDTAPQLLDRWLRQAKAELVLINTPLGPAGEYGLAALPGREAEFRQGVQRALDCAQATGCHTVHVMAGRPPPQTGSNIVRQTLIDNLRWAAPVARRAGIVLTLEALNRHDVPGYAYALPQQAVEVIEQVAQSNLRLQFDLYHAARESLPLPDTLRTLWPHVHHLQVAGAPHRHEPDLSAQPELLQALRWVADSNYAGWLGLEYTPRHAVRDGLAWRDALDRPA